MKPEQKTSGMYETARRCGRTIAEWTKALNNEYSSGELYRLAARDVDLNSLTRN